MSAMASIEDWIGDAARRYIKNDPHLTLPIQRPIPADDDAAKRDLETIKELEKIVGEDNLT